VPWQRMIWYCSGVSSAFHSASVFGIFLIYPKTQGYRSPWITYSVPSVRV
jgi:hypothetical protein